MIWIRQDRDQRAEGSDKRGIRQDMDQIGEV